MISDKKYGYNIGDIVYIPFMSDLTVGFYEVNAVNPLWIKNDDRGSFNSQHYVFSGIKFVCKNSDRLDV